MPITMNLGLIHFESSHRECEGETLGGVQIYASSFDCLLCLHDDLVMRISRFPGLGYAV